MLNQICVAVLWVNSNFKYRVVSSHLNSSKKVICIICIDTADITLGNFTDDALELVWGELSLVGSLTAF